jgi:AraC family transcriptional regulator, regulatory protein of adaptative response / methylated-DNA-[protein]-cysteine methyltransferase
MLSPMKHAAPTAFIAKICKLLEENPKHPPTLIELGARVGLSPYYLQRVFKQATGQSPKQYLKSKQLQALKTQLQNGTTVTTALYEAGYSSPSRLYEKANAYLGMTPALYKKGGPGLTIEYASVSCELGVILVAQTSKGVCAVRIGDTEEMLLRDLQREFFAARLVLNQDRNAPRLQQVLALSRGEPIETSIPLDIVSTSFQQKVWEALRQIPLGETRSYRQLAEQIGQPGASRAVGSACGKNPVALVVPCHRAVREDQSLGGYRWGLSRKQQLLSTEKTLPALGVPLGCRTAPKGEEL